MLGYGKTPIPIRTMNVVCLPWQFYQQKIRCSDCILKQRTIDSYEDWMVDKDVVVVEGQGGILILP